PSPPLDRISQTSASATRLADDHARLDGARISAASTVCCQIRITGICGDWLSVHAQSPRHNRVLRSSWTEDRLTGRLRFSPARKLGTQRNQRKGLLKKDRVCATSQAFDIRASLLLGASALLHASYPTLKMRLPRKCEHGDRCK